MSTYIMEFEWDTDRGGSKVHLVAFNGDDTQAKPGFTICGERMPYWPECEGQPASIRCKRCRAIASNLGMDIVPGLASFDPNLLEI